MADLSTDPYAVYPAREKGIGTRRWIEMVGVLHRLGYGRLRLACSWENAGPASSVVRRRRARLLLPPRPRRDPRPAPLPRNLLDGEPSARREKDYIFDRFPAHV